MNATYRIAFDETYCKTLIARYQQQRFVLMRPSVQIPLQPISIAVVWMVWARHDEFLRQYFGMLFWLILALAAFEWFYLKNAPLRRLMKKAGEIFTYTLTADQFLVHSPSGRAELLWTIFPEGVRYSDGLLLLRRGVICWLPDDHLSGASADEVTKLVESKTKLRHVA